MHASLIMARSGALQRGTDVRLKAGRYTKANEMLETEIKVTAEMVEQHGLTPEEYARIRQILGREPTFTELGIFSVMWSEHCSYKSSRVHLKRLPTEGPQVLQGPGENAGVVDVGDGWVAVFKIESHNHPSFVEPFQGAATGVGGILRDIFTMGARPIAVLDSLRFGPIRESEIGRNEALAAPMAELARRNRRLLEGVVGGIAFYGNCFGVPTCGGEIAFEPAYSGNPLVNVLALGIARREQIFYARARGSGNPVIYVGAKTGRDGIHGASLLASAEFSEESQQKRPNVQVGDPFMEKLLLEACLEAMRTGAVVGIQDMGAAGLTCSTCEMGARGGTGVEIDLQYVPQRETGMTPYEIMLSESQERMLLVAEKSREKEVFDIFHKWGLDAARIGQVTGDGMLRVRDHGKVVGEIPCDALAKDCPIYERPLEIPAPAEGRLYGFLPEGSNLTENFLRLLASPAIASKRTVFEQYDHMVRTNTVVGPGAGDAAVLRLKGTRRGLALSVDGNGRYCWLDPRRGAQLAVAEACRNVVCSGARPIAATNCLNFGNPEKPVIMGQFREVIDGMAEACRALGTPVTGGNVSFYNETLGQPIYPTPVIGILGVIEDISCAMGMGFREVGDWIILLEAGAHGAPGSLEQQRRTFSSSEYAKWVAGVTAGEPPAIGLDAERELYEAVLEILKRGLAFSAHDVSEGGLAVTLAESCFASKVADLGAEITLDGVEPAEFALFGESPSRILISAPENHLAEVLSIAAEYGVSSRAMGRTIPAQLIVRRNGRVVLASEASQLRQQWSNALEELLQVR